MREHKGNSLVALPADYVVIDTETTGLDYECCSIIEISAIRYSNGTQINQFSTLVQPEPWYYLEPDSGEVKRQFVDQFITDLTGITNEMLENAPTPETVIPQFMGFISDSILVGHNVNFDVNFLYDAAERHCDKHLTNDFIDTMRLARKLFPHLSHHRLSDIAAECKVQQPQAHRAEADCIVTAACYETMKAQILTEYAGEDEFAKHFHTKHKAYADRLASITANVEDIDKTNPIFGKVVVFTGALSSMSRKEAFQVAANLGATPADSVTKKTNYLVIGNADFAKSVKEGKTSKMKKAESFIAKGEEIAIISENAFFDMIADYL